MKKLLVTLLTVLMIITVGVANISADSKDMALVFIKELNPNYGKPGHETEEKFVDVEYTPTWLIEDQHYDYPLDDNMKLTTGWDDVRDVPMKDADHVFDGDWEYEDVSKLSTKTLVDLAEEDASYEDLANLFPDTKVVYFYAFEAKPTYTIKFFDYVDGTQIGKDVTVVAGEKVARPEDPTGKAKYRFDDWYIVYNYGTEKEAMTKYVFDGPVYDDYNIYARFVEQVAVTFNFNDGVTQKYIATFDKGDVIPDEKEPVIPTRSGYKFAGWFFDDKTFAEEYTYYKHIDEDCEVYAKWDLQTFKVDFDTDGGSKIDSQFVELNGKATKPANPVKEGYIFAGWYADATLKNPYNFNMPIDRDITIFAKWYKLPQPKPTPKPTPTTPYVAPNTSVR